jgi:hypothetical protein
MLGQEPADFGFDWQQVREGGKPNDPFSLYTIGFISDVDREAAHKKVRAWLKERRQP